MSQIIPPIKNALQAMISGFAEGDKLITKEESQLLLGDMVALLGHAGDFKKKLAELDHSLDQHPAFEPLYHYLFDLLMLSFIASDSAQLDENYLESDEWLKIEEETSDRGSEMLNLYIYLTEAHTQEIPIDLHDYLNEFLLADDDLYQDDFFIYEEILANEEIAEAGIDEILARSEEVSEEQLAEIYVPLLAFFNKSESAEEITAAIAASEHQTAIHLALYGALLAFADGLHEA